MYGGWIGRVLLAYVVQISLMGNDRVRAGLDPENLRLSDEQSVVEHIHAVLPVSRRVDPVTSCRGQNNAMGDSEESGTGRGMDTARAREGHAHHACAPLRWRPPSGGF